MGLAAASHPHGAKLPVYRSHDVHCHTLKVHLYQNRTLAPVPIKRRSRPASYCFPFDKRRAWIHQALLRKFLGTAKIVAADRAALPQHRFFVPSSCGPMQNELINFLTLQSGWSKVYLSLSVALRRRM